jgi:hypothetical protein
MREHRSEGNGREEANTENAHRQSIAQNALRWRERSGRLDKLRELRGWRRLAQ